MSAASTNGFVHLHNHSEYSMLDGAARVKSMVEEAVRLGQPAIGLTDHGYMFGAYEFYKEANLAGVKPVIGLEAYATPGTSRFDKTRVTWGESWQAEDDVSARGAYTHLTLIAHNTTGMHNLFRMATSASLDGQMGKWPRVDRQLLERYHDGVMVFTGCPSSAVQTRLRLGQWDEAVEEASFLRDTFGAENFYVELMDHGTKIEEKTAELLPKLAKHLGSPMVVTNDSHYVRREDAEVQDAILAINSGARLDEPPKWQGGTRFSFEGHGYYIRSTEDMRREWAHLPQALDATLDIAARTDVHFRTVGEGANYMPRFPTPEGENETSWFIKEVSRGLRRRFGEDVPSAVIERSKYEEEVILKMGFPGYFLVVADFIDWAKKQGIRVGPGRGSGAGSMVAYALGITELDPMKHGLLFERFLNPERVSMPDFDVDFDERRRDEVIDYVKAKYGDDRVAQVVTYGKIKARQALKDSSRIMGRDFKTGDELTKALPADIMGKPIQLSRVFDEDYARYAEAKEFRKLYEERTDLQDIVTLAARLEGLTRQWGVHACAVIMSSEVLTDVIPLMLRTQDGAIITQFDYPACEELGLLKMDFLGLRNLTVISDALINIERTGKEVPDINQVPLDDPETYKLLSAGNTLGVFQLEGAGMRELLRLMRPDNFEDISAVSALYRPGPMGAGSHTNYALRKNGRQEVVPIHPELKDSLADILEPTQGLIVYQEQVMQIAQRVAGHSLGQADILRRAMGKKDKATLDREFEPFRDGMLKNGYSLAAVNDLWDILVPFANYAFNKSHSAAYGLVSYWTAYLKTHYPAEYMAALLTSTAADKDKRALYLGECRRMNITVSRPDVNVSFGSFTADGDTVRFGLSSVRNVGVAVVDGIVKAREEKGHFTSFQDFLNKVPQEVCNKRTIQSLIKAGAFDGFGDTRRALLAVSDDAVEAVVGLKRNESAGQFDLFAAIDGQADLMSSFSVEVPNIPEWDRKEKLSHEREMLGLYVSDHPLRGMERSLMRHQNQQISEIKENPRRLDNKRVQIAGLITDLEQRLNRQGLPWAKATVEDFSGDIEVFFFSRQYERMQESLHQDGIVQISGRVSLRDDVPSITASDVTELALQDGDGQPVELRLTHTQCKPALLRELNDVLVEHVGEVPVRVTIQDKLKRTTIELGPGRGVNDSGNFYAAVKGLLGAQSVV